MLALFAPSKLFGSRGEDSRICGPPVSAWAWAHSGTGGRDKQLEQSRLLTPQGHWTFCKFDFSWRISLGAGRTFQNIFINWKNVLWETNHSIVLNTKTDFPEESSNPFFRALFHVLKELLFSSLFLLLEWLVGENGASDLHARFVTVDTAVCLVVLRFDKLLVDN